MNEKQCRAAVKQRSDGLCERCGSGYGQTLHHRINRSQLHKSRHWEIANCCMLCGDGTSPGGCHQWVGANPNDAADEGWHCRPWSDPLTEKVFYQRRWALLTEIGTVEFDNEEILRPP